MLKPSAILALSLCCATGAALAEASPSPNEALAGGEYMMLRNASLLRNGDNVWQRIRDGFQLEEVNPDIVRRHEQLYSARPEGLRRMLDRSRLYLFHIINEVERRGMPTELALLPLVESAFNPNAHSPVGASGLWQFMPATGLEYGLEQTWWYDGRRDVTAATRAALDYLENLNNQFNNWELALAAYNWGPGNVSRAIAKNRAKGLPETFESLNLPKETRQYVPKLLAIRNILANPDNFQITLDKLPNRPYFITVTPQKNMDISVAAKLAETSEEELKALNPAYNLPVVNPAGGRSLLIPAAKAERFERNLAHHDAPLLTWQPYTAQSEETLDDIASRFNMNPDRLRSANRLNSSRLTPGQTLLVSTANVRAESNTEAPAINTVPDSYLLAKDHQETEPKPAAVIVAAAEKKAAPAPVQLASAEKQPAEKQNARHVEPQPTLVAAAAKAPTPSATAPITTRPLAAHTDHPIEAQLASVSDTPPVLQLADASLAPSPSNANQHKTSALNLSDSIAKAIQSEKVEKIEKVADKTHKADKPEKADKADKTDKNRDQTLRYVVSKGDTLYTIANRHQMTLAELKAANPSASSDLSLGQILRVGNVAARERGETPEPKLALRQSKNDDKKSDLQAVKDSKRSAPTTQQYKVKRGDTLYSITRQFKLSYTDLKKWNDAKVLDKLRPGNLLVIEQ